jgi:nucleoside-diphosphate-sugar epimerase
LKAVILVTGASGFVGQNLLPYLTDRNNNVLAFKRADFEAENPIIPSDCSCIVHLAGKAHDLKNAANPDEYYRVNFELTKQLYDAFLESDAKKFIFISSVKAAADTVSDILTEEMEPLPKTDYGKSKLMAEQYIQSQPLPLGKSYFILRPCMIHGPKNKGNLNLLYKFIKKGIPYPLAAFKNKRSFLSIDNLCFAIQEIISKDNPQSGVYQVADDEPLSTSEVVNILAESLSKKPKLWHLPISGVQLIAKIGDFFKLPLNSERLKKLTESFVVSNKKIQSELGIKFPLSAREGLKVTADSFKETGQKHS